MKIRPTQTAFGCLSLVIGVEIICGLVFLLQILAIGTVSSANPVKVFSLVVQPWQQVIFAAWSFVGIPLTINAGVSVLYRVELAIRLMFYYMLVSFCVGTTIPVWLLLSGSVCNTVVDKEVQEMGSSFVCGFTDAFILMYSLLAMTFHVYLMYVVWSAAEDIARAPYPELMRYTAALKKVRVPDPPKDTNYPLSETRAIPGADLAQGVYVEGSQRSADKARPPSLTARPASDPLQQGSPQSFFPHPSSGMDFSSPRP